MTFRDAGVPRVTEDHAIDLLKRTLGVLATVGSVSSGCWPALYQLRVDIKQALGDSTPEPQHKK